MIESDLVLLKRLFTNVYNTEMMRTTTCKYESLVVSLHHPRHAEAEPRLRIGHQIFEELHQHLSKQDKQDIDVGRIQAKKSLGKLLDCRFPVTLNNHFLTDVWWCPSISYVKIWFHHPIDSQPFLNGWPSGPRSSFCSYILCSKLQAGQCISWN